MKRAAAIFFVTLLGLSVLPVSAQVYSTFYTFSNSVGSQPYAGLTASGNTLFGTTKTGGASSQGTVYSIKANGTGFGDLYSFSGADGANITASLILSSNTLYGAASQGGANSLGTLFSLAVDGSAFTNIHNFTGNPDGATPVAGLLLDGNMLYGTASSGTGGCVDGTIFSVETNGENFATLHVFGGADGSKPEGQLVLNNGVLFGTTYQGGISNLGTIFSIRPDGSDFRILHSFTNSDGALPAAGLVPTGKILYGTTSSGGAWGTGEVFAITTGGAFGVLYSFFHSPVSFSSDGAMPLASLFLTNNVLYGTTFAGGTTGSGTIFSIATGGTNYTQLYSLGGNNLAGLEPAGPVIQVGNFLYGSALEGGLPQSGTLYRLKIEGVAFNSEPSGETAVQVGSDIFFGAGAFSLTDAAATLQYQWRLNGVNIPGATTEGISFSDVQTTNGGSVTTTISDGTDAETSVPVEFSLDIQTSASGNDDFANRFMLGQVTDGAVTSSNVGATREAGEPEIIPGNPGGKSIWFEWEASVSGTAVFTTQGSDFDTIMGVFTGASVGALTRDPAAINDDDYGGYLTSRVSFNCSAGKLYEIVVDGYWGASGNVVLNWVAEDTPTPLAIISEVPPRQTVVSNGAAVTFVCRPTSGVPSWYFNGQPTGLSGTNLTVDPVAPSDVGTYVAQVTNGTGGSVTITEPAHLQINALEDGTTDINSVAWNKFLDSSSAAYSNPPQALVRKLGGGGDTQGFSVAQIFSTIGAQGEPGEPSIDGQIGGAPVWYTYVAPTNGDLLINTTGSDFNTMLGVFVGSSGSFATLMNVGAGYTTNRFINGQPQIYVPNVPKGQTNFIVVDGYKGASGRAQLNINLGDSVVITAPPQSQFVVAGSNVMFSVAASGSTPFSYLWQFNGTNLASATASSLTVSDVQADNIGQYSVVVSNLVSAASSSATLSLGTTPAITAQPLSQTVAAGSTVNLSVTASGTPSPDYQWIFNGSNIGTDGSALSIPNFQAGNQGSYTVVVSNSVGAVTSSAALVFLNTLRLETPTFNDNDVQLQLIGAVGGNYVLQTSFNLLTWTPLITNNATNGFLLFTDPGAGGFNRRFYRGVTN